jgi:hypothetical protein
MKAVADVVGHAFAEGAVMHAARATCQGQVILRRSPLLVNTFTTRSPPWTWMTAWICALMCLLNLEMMRMEVMVFVALSLCLKAPMS